MTITTVGDFKDGFAILIGELRMDATSLFLVRRSIMASSLQLVAIISFPYVNHSFSKQIHRQNPNS